MAKKKKSIQESATTVMVEGAEITSEEEDTPFTALCRKLTEINKTLDLTGYTIKNTTSAVINIKNQEKLADYSILAAQAMKTSEDLSELFKLGNVNYILIEGKNQKILCMTIGENKVNIIMENDADHMAVIKQLLP